MMEKLTKQRKKRKKEEKRKKKKREKQWKTKPKKSKKTENKSRNNAKFNTTNKVKVTEMTTESYSGTLSHSLLQYSCRDCAVTKNTVRYTTVQYKSTVQ